MLGTRSDRLAGLGRRAEVLLAAALVGTLFLVSRSWAGLVSAIALLLALAVLSREPRSRGLALVGLSLYVIVGSGSSGLWPLSGLLAVLLAFVTAKLFRAEQAWRPWLRTGTWTHGVVPWTVLAIIGLTGIALVAWQRLLDGRPPQEYLEAASGGRSGSSSSLVCCSPS